MENVFTSEIHATLNSVPEPDGDYYVASLTVSRRKFGGGDSDSKEAVFDEDGDLVRISRGNNSSEEEDIQIHLRHYLRSSLDEVGSQLWGGSLLLGDLIISHPQTLFGNVLEIGSGTGLTALAAASCIASPIFSSYIVTDLEPRLELIKKNLSSNPLLHPEKFSVRPLDLLSQPPEWIRHSDVILAGDVIYDDELTQGIISNLLPQLKKTAVLYFGIERRYVFTVKDLEVVPQALNTFLNGLSSLGTVTEEPLPPQKFSYHRSKDLILLKVVLN